LTPLVHVNGIQEIATDGGVTRLTLAPGCDPASTIASVTSMVPTARIEVARLRLEDVFVRLVSADATAGAAELRAALRAPEAVETV
jgi:hypothetical protein